MRLRLLIGAAGVALGLFGALRFVQLDFPDIVDATLWLVGGVVVHDALLAPLTLAVVVLGTRVVAPRVRTAVTVGLVVLATVTVTAIPVLGSWGAREDNPTLLDRNYLLGWVVFAALVLVATVFAALRAGAVRPATTSAGDDDEQQPHATEDGAPRGQQDGDA